MNFARSLTFSVCLLVSLSVAGLSAAQGRPHHEGKAHFDDIPEPMRTVLVASNRLRYSGTRTVSIRRAGVVETHEEYITRDGSSMRIEFGTGSKLAGQIIVEDRTQRRHYLPDRNEIHVSGPRLDATEASGEGPTKREEHLCRSRWWRRGWDSNPTGASCRSGQEYNA